MNEKIAMTKYDAIIIGGGVAGLSIAYQLANKVSVLLLEQESQLAYHSTGRSAALYAASYGSQYPAIHTLSKASNEFFKHPPSTLCETPLLTPRGLLSIVHKDDAEQLEEHYLDMQHRIPSCRLMQSSDIVELVSNLHTNYCQQAIYDPNVYDVDVHGLLEVFRKGCIQNSGQVKTKQTVKSLQFSNGGWTVETESETFSSPIVINAAGAWADHVAQLANIKALGVQPLRRSAILVDPPKDTNVTDWPMVVEMNETFYFKPDAGQLMVSPADETPSTACDSRPEQLEIAMAADYVETALAYHVQKIKHSWSGLRCFTKDRSPVIGYSEEKPGFFWLAALGGYGVQTAPAMGRFAASLVLKHAIPEDIVAAGMRETFVTPSRFS